VSSLFALTISAFPPLGNEEPGKYADDVMDLVKENADPHAVGFDGFSPECGNGLIDAEKTVKNAAKKNESRKKTLSD
jgi:hypothetical protein